jgi:hypothetical protein
MFGLLVGRARDGVLEVGIVQRVAQKLHHLPHLTLAGDDAKRIVRRLGGVDFRAGQRHARDEVFQILPHAGADVKLARLLSSITIGMKPRLMRSISAKVKCRSTGIKLRFFGSGLVFQSLLVAIFNGLVFIGA